MLGRAHFLNQFVVHKDSGIVDMRVPLRFFSRYRKDRLHIDFRLGLGGFYDIDKLAVFLNKHVAVNPPELVDAQHNIYFAEFMFFYGVGNGKGRAALLYRLFGKSGIHRQPYGGVIGGLLRAGVKHKPFGTRIADEAGVSKILFTDRRCVGVGIGRRGGCCRCCSSFDRCGGLTV
ncbi:hypothetical protein SDC9_186735 [bioreactor metagenome]|uniref:Uncharacterized protein n=1 Tax=bioreactor metagenome TaxID=1076179 RepID=A0A645HJQ4_9ZZZZ